MSWGVEGADGDAPPLAVVPSFPKFKSSVVSHHPITLCCASHNFCCRYATTFEEEVHQYYLLLLHSHFSRARAGQPWAASAHPRLRGRDRGVRALFTSRRVRRVRLLCPSGQPLQGHIASGTADWTITWISDVLWPKLMPSTQKRDLLSPSSRRTGGCPQASPDEGHAAASESRT